MLTKFPSALSIRLKVLLGFGLALMTVAIVAIVTYRSIHGFLRTADGASQISQLIETHEMLSRHAAQLEGEALGFVLRGDEHLQRAFENSAYELLSCRNFLRSIDADQEEKKWLDEMNPLIEDEIAFLKRAMEIRRAQGVEAATAVLKEREPGSLSARIVDAVQSRQEQMSKALAKRMVATKRISRITAWFVMGGSISAFVLLLSAAVFILRDIGARRKAEEDLAEERNRLSSVIDAIPDHVFVKDIAGRYVIGNRSYRTFIGCNTPEGVVGKTARDFFPIEVAIRMEQQEQEILNAGKPLINREEPGISSSSSKWVSTTRVPLRDTDGEVAGIVCVSRDISERKAAEERLRLTAAQLERSNRELQDFASVASHDLQEPLRKILAFSDRLRVRCGAAVGEQGGHYLERIQDAALRMQTLIHDLLTLSRVTSKAQPFVAVDLCETVWDVVSDLEVRIEQCGAKIEVGSLPMIDGDPLQIRQLFQNLISNALKFQRPNVPPVVNISGKVLDAQERVVPGTDPGGKVCQILIQDNGIGFDQKYAERIFVVFQRLHARSEFEGTGIGLAVVRKIIDRHGGDIVARSAEGEGATFIVTLPLRQRMKEQHD